jgi:TetR/AcrR family transcriptional regulator, transcriptional repressor for nem operon
MMKYRAEHKANTRRRVLQEAAKAIRTEGVERMGVASVMAAAGLTVGGFYAHFKSKDDLVAEAVNFMFEERYSTFFETHEAGEPRAALIRFVHAYLSMRHRNSMVGGCPLPVLAGQLPHLPKPARERFLFGFERLTATLARFLEALDVKDAAPTARMAIAEMMGALSLARITRDDQEAEALLQNMQRSMQQKLGL